MSRLFHRNEGHTLHYAINYFYFNPGFHTIAIIDALINAQADVNAPNLDGDTPLDNLLARKESYSPSPLVDILFVIDDSPTRIDRRQESLPNESEVGTDNEQTPRFFERDHADLLVLPPIIDDPLVTDSIETDVLRQLYPQDRLSFMEDIEKRLLAAGAKTQFDIKNSDWFHH